MQNEEFELMKLAIDDLLALTHPWDFVITTGGRDYPTRRPTVGELGVLSDAANQTRDQLKTIAASLFDGSAPENLPQWNDSKLLGFFGGYMAYLKSRTDLEKKMDPVAMAIAAVERQQAEQKSSNG